MKSILKVLWTLGAVFFPSIAFAACPPSHTTHTAHVFGMDICAEKGVPKWAINHATAIASEYIDNNENGKADHPGIVSAFKKNKAVLLIFKSQNSAEDFEFEQIRDRVGQDLYVTEMHPNTAKDRVFDASLEEILHLITQAGYASLHPNVFGTGPGTDVSNAMDKARGGFFKRAPRRYPQSAWYSYHDSTCNYECHSSEYIYWAITSYLGAHSAPWRYKEIADEWRAATPEKLRQIDPDIIKIITNPAYHIPSKLPDGHYNPRIK